MSERVFGCIGVFDDAGCDRRAPRAHLRQSGFDAFEAYTPYPVERLDRDRCAPAGDVLLPLMMFAGAVFGAACGYFIQYWDEALGYPLNVGGRPHNSWPAFIVSAFEFMLLCAVAAGFLGLLSASRLPRLYHPIFAAEDFERASRDRFVLCVEGDAIRASSRTASARSSSRLGAEQIEEVPA